MRKWLLALAFLFLLPLPAAAVDCDFAAGYSAVGPIGTVVGAGNSCTPITANDVIVVPDGATVGVVDSLALTGAGTGYRVESGGTLIIDVMAHDTAPGMIGLEAYEGTDVGGTNVMVYVEPGGTLETHPAWLQNGNGSSPALVGMLANDNYTIWTIDEISPCGGDCVTDPNLECFTYTNARSNVQGGSVGESHLDHALAAVVVDEMQVRMLDLDAEGAAPAEWPRTYPIASVDSTGPDYSLCIDITEPGWETGGYRTEDLTGSLISTREIVATTLAADAEVGDKCVTVAGTALAADGDYVGRWFRPDGESDEPYRIMRTVNGVDCDGGAAGDSLYLPDETPIHMALASAGDATIDYGFRRGEAYGVMAPVIFSGSDNVALSDSDQKVIIEGTADVDGLEVYGAGELRFKGASVSRCVDIHTRDTGRDGYAAIVFEAVSGVRCSKISTMGGDGVTQAPTGQAAAVLFDDVSGRIVLNDSAFRYFGDGGFSVSGSTVTGSLDGSRLIFEHILSDATNSGPLDLGGVGLDYFADVSLSDVNEFDAVRGTGGNAVETGSNPVSLRRVTVGGQTNGGLGTGVGLSLDDFIAEWLVTAFSSVVAGSTADILPIRCSGCDIRHIRATAATAWFNPYTSHYQDFIFSDFITHSTTNGILLVGKGMYYDNGVLWNLDTDSGSCVAADCAMVKASFDGNPDTDDVYTRMTVGWDPGTTSKFNYLWTYSAGFTGEDLFTLGSVGTWNLTNSTRNGGNSFAWEDGADLDAGITAGTVQFVGPLCTQGNVTTAGSTYTDAPVAFLTAVTASHLYRGHVHPLFDDADRGDYSLVKGSLADVLRCGPLTGNEAPGPNRHVMQFGMSGLGAGPGLRPVLPERRAQ